MNTPVRPVLSRRKALAATAFSLLTAQWLPASAATDLADIPLFNATSINVLPNIFFIFDNSGSMTSNYMPDYVTDSYCKRNNTQRRNCAEGDPPFYAAGFNSVYYDPTITYSPPRDAAGNIKAGWNGWLASAGTWTAVPIDGYKTIDSGTINLTNGYPERIWCNAAGTVCKNSIDAGNTYSFPDGTYNIVKTVYGAPLYYTATVEWCSAGGSPWGNDGTCQERKTSTYSYVKYSNWTTVRIVPTTASYAKAANRTDCLGSTCTYAEEMANFANWYAWYRTRQQMMKTAMSLVFDNVRGTPDSGDPLDKNFFHARVGFTTISNTGTTDGTGYLAIDEFDGNVVGTGTQRGKFFDRLFKASGNSYTPLRGALTKAGRIYGGKIGTDPIQYSCQRNYTILSTDGYWNTDTETTSYTALKLNGTSAIGDMDGAVSCNTALVTPKCNASGTCDHTPTRPECDTKRKSNTLADIAYYYYHADLREGTCEKCTDNVPSGGGDVKVNDVANWQHMTTYTIGLGVDGTLEYTSGYKTAISGDYFNIKTGATGAFWPDPIANTEGERIDDLWHAAVNGRGTYFSAQNPRNLVQGLTKALDEMNVTGGAGASAAASSLQLTAGDNYVYVADYRTGQWDGNVSAYTIAGSTGVVNATAVWQAQPLLNTLVSGTCGDVESRLIYTGRTTRKAFTWAELDSTERTYFANNKLTQWGDWTSADQTAAAASGGEWLVGYLRGHNRYEDQDRDTGPTSAFQLSCAPHRRLYRDRENILGDFVHAQPIYFGQPRFSYVDDGYTAYKAVPRSPRLYAQANDGMLHAFSGTTGIEQWAYVPPVMMKTMYHLAESDYSNNHRYFLDGPLTGGDIYDGGWKSILVGAMGKGARGIYALDVTGTGSDYPKVLWNFTADDEPNLGYTYGASLITKLGDGTWVVVVASGYNNVPNEPTTGDYPSSDGVGRLFVLRASDGVLLKTISTGVGSVANPAGLGDINNHVPSRSTDNTTLRVYGGDLLGNLWGFDLDNEVAYKIAQLDQPITAAPGISSVDGTPVLFFGTGRYLGQSDMTSIPQQSIYAIKDGGATATPVGRNDLVAQTMSGSRTVTANTVDWNTKAGWYVDLPAGELVYLPAQIYAGALVAASIAPSATACEPGGSGYLYVLNFRTGSAVDNRTDTVTGTYYASPVVGFSLIKTVGDSSSDGEAKPLAITAEGKIKTGESVEPPAGPSGGGRRIMWREIVD